MKNKLIAPALAGLLFFLLAQLPAAAQVPIARPGQAAATHSGQAAATHSGQAAAAQPHQAAVPHSGQAAVTQAQTLSTSLSALSAALQARLAATAPTVQGQAYRNPESSRLVFALCEMAPLYGNGADATVTAGFLKEVQEAAAQGIDGFALDTFNDSSYLTLDADMIAAIDQYNAARTVNGTIPSNGHGVSRFYWLFCPDYINGAFQVDPVRSHFADFMIAHGNDPSCARYNGQPVMTCYAGDGGGVPVVTADYPPLLAKIRAGGVNIGYWPGWGGDGGSAAADELNAVGAIGGWAFPPKDTPLGAYSPLANVEALGASVSATASPRGPPLLWMQPIFPNGPYDGGLRAGSYWYDAGGSRSMAAQFASAKMTQHPVWVMLLTWDDWGEGTGITKAASTAWMPGNWGYFGSNYIGLTPGFFQPTDGLETDLSYCIQEWKTGQPPVIASDTLTEYNRTETAAASLAAGAVSAENILGDPPGLPDPVDVTVYAKASGKLELSGVGPLQVQSISAGVNRLRFSGVQAGTPFLQLKRRGQVVRQLVGHPISATATVIPSGATKAIPNLSISSAVSVPGVSFTMTVPLPAYLNVDRVGLVSRSSNASVQTLGFLNLKATDIAPAAPVIFAQNSLNAPASIGRSLDLIAVPGAEPLTQYENPYSQGECSLFADNFDAAQPPVGINSVSNQYCVYYAASKPLPSAHIRLEGDVVCLSSAPGADASEGVALVSSTAPGGHYYGAGELFFIHSQSGSVTLEVRALDSVLGDTNSQGAASLGTAAVNSLTPGESYHLTVDANLAAQTATVTATPSNQQL